ncbi:ROK family protein [Klebsiella indica]|uniref:ROK family protein n=1 Tax=Klebsiella indica TaxID=2582917 RepID=A0A5R9LCS3_9ENTR|nr:ROK family protein [Klebsiella indica]TLV08817.1 ROK family protein [Klebsiella indica]
MLYLGIDIGGSKIAAVVMDATGHEVARYRTSTTKDTYEMFIAGLMAFIVDIRNKVDSDMATGIALPGSISPVSGRIKNSNILVLNGQNLKSDLADRLGAPVIIANDANCFALSEACDGAGQGYGVVFGLTLGTGCGGGIAIHQQLFPGAWGNAAECGHIALPGYRPVDDGPDVICYCGKRNCSESFVSGSGLAERYYQLCAKRCSAPEILQRVKKGESQAQEQIQRFRYQLARLLATVVNIIDPHIIVLGGGLSNEPLLIDAIDKEVAPLVFTDMFQTPIVKARHGDSSGMRGAAWLAVRQNENKNAPCC